MDAARISRADTVADVLEELDALLEPGDAVLVKASPLHGPYPYRRRIGQLMFSLFSAYPTFMIFLGVAIAMVITMVLMPAWIRFLKTSHIGQQVRADGPQSHLVKQGTPTMGGVIMLIAVIVFTLLASVGALPRSCGFCSAPRWPPVSSGSSMMPRRWPTSDRSGSRPRRS